MLDLEGLKMMIIISIALSSITCTLVQKTKGFFHSSEYITVYSLIINLFMSILFCKTFTNIDLPNSLWIGLFSFLGADSIYKSLEGKLSSYTEIVNKGKVTILEDNIINKEDQ